jgi:hypothetical protein
VSAKRLLLASNNAKKLTELRALLVPLGVELLAQGDLAIAEAAEPFDTFLENALAKARHAAHASGLPTLADDSGLCVDALGGNRRVSPVAQGEGMRQQPCGGAPRADPEPLVACGRWVARCWKRRAAPAASATTR